jgi:hypothetical protein
LPGLKEVVAGDGGVCGQGQQRDYRRAALAKAFAVANPLPIAAPVTRATLSSKVIGTASLGRARLRSGATPGVA